MKPLPSILFCGALALAGCVNHTTGSDGPSLALGRSAGIPGELVSGAASAWSFLSWGPRGDDSQEAAAKAARGGALEAELVDLRFERKTICFPACSAALWRRTTTIARGTLVRPAGYAEPEKAKKEPMPTVRDPIPGAETLYQRVLHMYAEDPAAAASFYSGLGVDERQVLRDHIASQKGVRSSYDSSITLREGATPAERAFLIWFLNTHTGLQPK